MNLFIDTSNNYIIFSLFSNDSVMDYTCIETNRNQSEIFIDELNNFLLKNNYKLEQIDNFFFAQGPGSFTGIRVGLTVAKALKVSGCNNVYVLSSLEILFNQYNDCKAIIDARGNKYYYQKVKDGVFSTPTIIEKDSIDIQDAKQYENSFENIAENVLNLVKAKRYSLDIDSLYIKDAF
ncbi:tRNA threonylcarbamoyladenosine biosynthesis protein TsaB [Bacilli bacterium PM5-3]|nr:tRNA threonylcarbamoyladenosine biosynthesis protein TsaB [Bacilli bacterium PM5-3]